MSAAHSAASADSAPPGRARRAAGAGDLAGIRIVSLALNVPGPVALARLVAEGASAIKIEPPGGDPLSGFSRRWYRALHAGVTVEACDLKTEAGQRRLFDHLARADLLLTSQRPAALARLGLDREKLARTLPRLRLLQIVGDSRAPDEPGHDLTYQARAGLIGGEMPRTLLADLIGAERAVIAALLLLRRESPAWARVGLQDALDTAATPLRLELTTPGGPLGGGMATYRIYDAGRGRVAVAALEPHFRARLYEALGLPDGHDLTDALRARTAKQWEQWARKHDLPLACVESPRRRG